MAVDDAGLIGGKAAYETHPFSSLLDQHGVRTRRNRRAIDLRFAVTMLQLGRLVHTRRQTSAYRLRKNATRSAIWDCVRPILKRTL
jgi:hypothetical protein